jgi:hypothetical protein
MPRTYQMNTKSFSYHELMSGKINRAKLEALANAGKLNEETLARIGHIGRFYQRISKACPNPNLKISDVLTGDQLQKIWNETADDGVTTGQCPLVIRMPRKMTRVGAPIQSTLHRPNHL